MKKDKIKNNLDFVPLFILTISGIILLLTVLSTESDFLWKHIVGLCLLPIIFLAFLWRHKIGVLVLGLTLIFGLFSMLSYNYNITTTNYWIGIAEVEIPIFYGQPIFLLWLIIHYIFSGRHYVGIRTKEYWKELLKEPSKNAID